MSDLGEEALPEPSPVPAAPSTASATASSSTEKDAIAATVETQEPDVKPVSERLPGDEGAKDEGVKPDVTPVTIAARQPLKLPASISIHITPENLKDYVGA